MPRQPSGNSLILYTDSAYFSGAEKSLGILARSLSGEGYDLKLVVTPTAADRFAEYVGKDQLETGARRSKLDLGFYNFWLRRLRKERPAAVVVNMWSPYANTLFLLAARAAHVPSIAIYHYYQERSAVTGPLAPLKLLAYGLGERLATRVLTVSQAHRTILIDQFGFPAAKVGVIPNGTAPAAHAPDFTDHSPRRLLAIGSLEPAKGYDFLLKVLATVTVPWELTIVGDGPERESLEALAKKQDLPVRFAGLQKEVSSYYASHEVLVHPSHFENLSMAIIESMSFGLTCLANDVGGNRELIENGTTGWLLPLHDTQAWQAALTEACQLPLLDKRQAAYTRWKLGYTTEIQVESFKSELASLPHARY